MTNEDSSESKKFSRAKPRYAVDLKVEMFTKGLNHHYIERAANISIGGLFVCTDVLCEVGEKIHLRIIFSDRDSFFDVKAKVAWVCDGSRGHPKGFGVQFTDTNSAQEQVIQNLLANYVNIRNR